MPLLHLALMLYSDCSHYYNCTCRAQEEMFVSLSRQSRRIKMGFYVVDRDAPLPANAKNRA